jgi:mono/diheme cytochrome c family protein
MRGFVSFLGVFLVAAVVGAVIRYNRSPAQAAGVVPLPDRTYTPALFDTITWSSNEAAITRGKDVFNWVCAKCHGPQGHGDGGYVIEGDTLHPPSFVQPDWRFATNAKGLWQRIYLGNNRGMPHWGDQGLQPRDVVAVATYIQKELRKDVK